MTEKPKQVIVLKSITPSQASMYTEKLDYENLAEASNRYMQQEQARQEVFWQSPEGTLEEYKAATQLAQQYMLAGAAHLNYNAVSDQSKKLWSERYTQASTEIYGAPDPQRAQSLYRGQIQAILSLGADGSVDEALMHHFVNQIDTQFASSEYGVSGERLFGNAAARVGIYLERRYASVYDALALELSESRISPEGIASRFEAALVQLAETDDVNWSNWSVVRDEKRNNLSVVPGDTKILVGMNRATVSPQQLKGLFSHEILVHAQRSVNGSKLSPELSKGLPGYLDSEEGLGVFWEYAATGDIPEKIIDRYIDISLATGAIDSRPRNRAELIDFALTRELIRNETRPKDERLDGGIVKQNVYTHVNRIYRGSLGNEFIGVFTKDLAYYEGFHAMGAYIEQELQAGRSIDDIAKYILLGKFDPTNGQHVAYLHEIKQSQENGYE